MKAQDLAALAALGAVGYHLSQRGKGGKGGAEAAVDASPEAASSDDYDAESSLERRYPKPSGGGMRPQDVMQGRDSSVTSNPFKKVKDKGSGSLSSTGGPSRYNRAADSNAAGAVEERQGSGGIRPQDITQGGSSVSDKIAALNEKNGAASVSARQTDALRATSRKAAAEDAARRRASGTLPQIQVPGTQSMARYPGGLAKRGANVSVPEDQPITRPLGTDQNYIDAMMATAPVGPLAKLAAKAAYRNGKPLNYYDQPALGGPNTPLLGAPAKQLTGPSKTDLMARDRANRASEREDAMMRENADRYGLNPNAPGYDAAASSLRERLGGRDFTLKKKGGVIKKMASGGMTSRSSSASSRGDGIAQRGKTKGRMR
jgi:hypothetical protein